MESPKDSRNEILHTEMTVDKPEEAMMNGAEDHAPPWTDAGPSGFLSPKTDETLSAESNGMESADRIAAATPLRSEESSLTAAEEQRVDTGKEDYPRQADTANQSCTDFFEPSDKIESGVKYPELATKTDWETTNSADLEMPDAGGDDNNEFQDFETRPSMSTDAKVHMTEQPERSDELVDLIDIVDPQASSDNGGSAVVADGVLVTTEYDNHDFGTFASVDEEVHREEAAAALSSTDMTREEKKGGNEETHENNEADNQVLTSLTSGNEIEAGAETPSAFCLGTEAEPDTFLGDAMEHATKDGIIEATLPVEEDVQLDKITGAECDESGMIDASIPAPMRRRASEPNADFGLPTSFQQENEVEIDDREGQEVSGEVAEATMRPDDDADVGFDVDPELDGGKKTEDFVQAEPNAEVGKEASDEGKGNSAAVLPETAADDKEDDFEDVANVEPTSEIDKDNSDELEGDSVDELPEAVADDTDDDFGSFSDFNDASIPSRPVDDLRSSLSAEGDSDEDEDFGDFTDFSDAVPTSSDTDEASQIPTENERSPQTEDVPSLARPGTSDNVIDKAEILFAEIFDGNAAPSNIHDNQEKGTRTAVPVEDLLARMRVESGGDVNPVWPEAALRSLLSTDEPLGSSSPRVVVHEESVWPNGVYSFGTGGLPVESRISQPRKRHTSMSIPAADIEPSHASEKDEVKPDSKRETSEACSSMSSSGTVVALPPLRCSSASTTRPRRLADADVSMTAVDNTTRSSPASTTAQQFISQVPDLSFMLKSTLSLPSSPSY